MKPSRVLSNSAQAFEIIQRKWRKRALLFNINCYCVVGLLGAVALQKPLNFAWIKLLYMKQARYVSFVSVHIHVVNREIKTMYTLVSEIHLTRSCWKELFDNDCKLFDFEKHPSLNWDQNKSNFDFVRCKQHSLTNKNNNSINRNGGNVYWSSFCNIKTWPVHITYEWSRLTLQSVTINVSMLMAWFPQLFLEVCVCFDILYAQCCKTMSGITGSLCKGISDNFER